MTRSKLEGRKRSEAMAPAKKTNARKRPKPRAAKPTDNVIRCDNGLPRSGKQTKYTGSSDDFYCTNVSTLLGADKPPPEHSILLVVLGLGPQLRGYDEVHYALPMEQTEVQTMAAKMRQDAWKLPTYNITKGVVQNEYCKQTEKGWKNWEKKKLSMHASNNQYDVNLTKQQTTAGWIQVQAKIVICSFLLFWCLDNQSTP